MLWIRRNRGRVPEPRAYQRLILSHHKNLNAGVFLVDDRTRNGADNFLGEHVHFGHAGFDNSQTVTAYLLSRLLNSTFRSCDRHRNYKRRSYVR